MNHVLKFIRAVIINLAFVAAALMFSLTPCHLQDFHNTAAGSSYYSQNISQQFCHVNDFSGSSEAYDRLESTHIEDVNDSFVAHNVECGRPFVVSAVTRDWKANEKWDSDYFKSVFSDFELFSSTFATNVSPVFDSTLDEKDMYYGIFLNDRSVAEVVSADYKYPSFIPHHLRMQGTDAHNIFYHHF